MHAQSAHPALLDLTGVASLRSSTRVLLPLYGDVHIATPRLLHVCRQPRDGELLMSVQQPRTLFPARSLERPIPRYLGESKLLMAAALESRVTAGALLLGVHPGRGEVLRDTLKHAPNDSALSGKATYGETLRKPKVGARRLDGE